MTDMKIGETAEFDESALKEFGLSEDEIESMKQLHKDINTFYKNKEPSV